MLSNCNYTKRVPLRYFLSNYPDLLTNYLVRNDYYSADNDTLSKLYKLIGLDSLDFVKGLYNLESNYASNKVSEHLKSSNIDIVVDDNNHFIVANEDSISNYNFLIDYINLNYTNSTACNEHTSVFRNDKGEGGLINHSFITEKIDLYGIKYVDDLFYIDKSVSIDLNDENFRIIVKTALSNIYIPYVNLDIKLTYYEYLRVIKMCRLKYKKLFTDDDFSRTFGLKSEHLKTITSDYTIKDALNLITSNLDSVDLVKLLKFYKNIYSEKLYSFGTN